MCGSVMVVTVCLSDIVWGSVKKIRTGLIGILKMFVSWHAKVAPRPSPVQTVAAASYPFRPQTKGQLNAIRLATVGNKDAALGGPLLWFSKRLPDCAPLEGSQ